MSKILTTFPSLSVALYAMGHEKPHYPMPAVQDRKTNVALRWYELDMPHGSRVIHFNIPIDWRGTAYPLTKGTLPCSRNVTGFFHAWSMLHCSIGRAFLLFTLCLFMVCPLQQWWTE